MHSRRHWWLPLGLGAREWVTGLAEDPAGGILLLGFSIAASARPFLVRLLPSGTVDWIRPYADGVIPGSDQQAFGLALGPGGAIYTAGFDKGVTTPGLRPGLSDGVLTRLNPDGSGLWHAWIGSPRLEQLAGVGTTPSGSVLVAGWTDGTVSAANAGGMDLLIQSFSPDGSLLWSRQLGGSGQDRPSAMATTADGGLVVVGHSDGLLAGLPNRGLEDAFVLRFDAAGTLVWARSIATNGTDHGYGVLVTPDGDILVTGRMAGRDWSPAGGDPADAYLARFSPDGSLRWLRRFGSSAYDYGRSLALTPGGDILVSGRTEGDLQGLANQGGFDGYVALFSADGRHLGSRLHGTAGNDSANALLSLAAGDVIIAGMTEGNLEGRPNEAPGTYDLFVERTTLRATGPWRPRLTDPRPDGIELTPGSPLAGSLTLWAGAGGGGLPLTLPLGGGAPLTLTGLDAGQRYSYRLEAAGETLEGGFRTLPTASSRELWRLVALPASPSALSPSLADLAEQLQPQVLLAASPSVLSGAEEVPLLQRTPWIGALAGDQQNDVGPLTVVSVAEEGAADLAAGTPRWEAIRARLSLLRSAGRTVVLLLPSITPSAVDRLAQSEGVAVVVRAPLDGLLELQFRQYIQSTPQGASACLSVTPLSNLGNRGPTSHTQVDTMGAPLPNSVAAVDTSPPPPPRLQLQKDSGSSATDGLTQEPGVQITGLEAGSLWQWSADGGRRWADGSGGGLVLPVDGGWSLLARQIDRSGLVSPVSVPLTVTLDRQSPGTIPVVSSLRDDHGNLQGLVPALGWFSDRTPLLQGTLAAAPGPTEQLMLKVNGQTMGNARIGPGGIDWSIQPVLKGPDGPVTVQLQLVDGAGNAGPASLAFQAFLDSTAPTTVPSLTALIDDQGSRQGPLTQGAASDDDTPLLQGTLSGPLASGETIEVMANGIVIGTVASLGAGNRWSLPLQLPKGPGTTINLTARVVDTAGNAGRASAARRLLVDTVAPAMTTAITTVLDDHGARQGAAMPGDWISDRTPRILGSLTAPAGAGEVVQVLNGDTLLGNAVLGPDRRSWGFTATVPASVAALTLRARVVDAAGNAGALSADYPLLVDSLAPGIVPTITALLDDSGPVTGPMAAGGTSDDFTPVVVGTLPGPAAPGEVVEVLDGARALGTAMADPLTGLWSLPLTLATTLNRQLQLRARVVDLAGNTGQMTYGPTCTLASPPPSGPVLRLLPLGDSLTDGGTVPGGYRAGLQQQGQNLGRPLDLVGRKQQLLAADPSPDPDHWGVPGLTVAGLTAQLPAAMASLREAGRAGDPKAVLLLIGTNDLLNASTAAATPAALGNLLQTLDRLIIPGTAPLTVLIGTLPALRPPTQTARVAADALALNSWITEAAPSLSTPQMSVLPVNLTTPLEGLLDAGGIHPTAQGYGVMADRWIEALQTSGLL
jgi:lysophospholipase L1-like esterase/outer membrane protein assembly factor BamB